MPYVVKGSTSSNKIILEQAEKGHKSAANNLIQAQEPGGPCHWVSAAPRAHYSWQLYDQFVRVNNPLKIKKISKCE